MVRTPRWKYVEFDGFRPQLFDLEADPRELCDLGDSPDHAEIRRELHERLCLCLRTRKIRVTTSDAEVEARTDSHKSRGILFGEW